MSDTLPQALASVTAQMAAAAARVGRSSDSIRLIAVSKQQTVVSIRQAYALGVRDFGENFVQELAQKAAQLVDLPELRWHMIGHLQRNKAKHVARVCHCVQSVDRPELAQELGARRFTASDSGELTPLRVLVQVNVGQEAHKSGCSIEALPTLLDTVEGCEGLQLAGLMAIPPATESAEQARPYFQMLAELVERHGGRARLPELSMGMSQDFVVAIECGATLVRVGTRLFGQRRV